MGVAADIIRRRIASANLEYVHEVDETRVLQACKELQKALSHQGWSVMSVFNGEDVCIADISRWILELPIDKTVSVLACWPSNRYGIVVRADSLFQNLEQVWQPGSDDLWVEGEKWGILVDHEEQITVFHAMAR